MVVICKSAQLSHGGTSQKIASSQIMSSPQTRMFLYASWIMARHSLFDVLDQFGKGMSHLPM